MNDAAPSSKDEPQEWAVITFAKEALAKASSPREAVRHFLGETIWTWDLERLQPPQRRAVEGLRLLYLVGRGFVSSRAQQQAMALTYTTMLALVPAFAIMVAIFSVRGLQEARGRLETFIIEALAASNEQAAVLSRQLGDLVTNLQGSGGVAGITFFVFLFFTIIALLSNLEKTLNDIWQIKRHRSFVNKLVTYWCIATLGPIFLGTALVQGSSLQTRVSDWSEWGKQGVSSLWSSDDQPPEEQQAGLTAEELFLFGGVGGSIAAELEAHQTKSADKPSLEYILVGTRHAGEDSAFSLLGMALTVITFTLLYALFPNTHVRLKPALVGAVVATILWTGTKWALALSSSTLVRYNTIYGSLATIPITMFWLYLTWLIVILGAELSFAVQNLKSQRKEELATETSQLCAELVALRLCAEIGRRYERGEDPPDLEWLAEHTGAPTSLCASLLYHLVQDGLLREIEVQEERGYVPARPLDRITVADVVASLRERRGIAFDLEQGPDLELVKAQLDRANAAAEKLASGVSLRRLVVDLEISGQHAREALAAGPSVLEEASPPDVGEPEANADDLPVPVPVPEPATD